jgi:hypothetical protein
MWPWSFWSLFRCRRATDVVAFPLAGCGGKGVEEDGTTIFFVRVVYGLFLRYDYRGVKLLRRPWWRGEDAARCDVGGWDLLLGDLGLEILLGLPHLLHA